MVRDLTSYFKLLVSSQLNGQAERGKKSANGDITEGYILILASCPSASRML